MRQHYGLVILLLVCISKYQADDTTPMPTPPVTTTPVPWNGDPKLCTVNPLTTTTAAPAPPPVLKFPTKAEFTLERIELKSLLDTAGIKEMSLYQYLYDYDNNFLILIKNQLGFLFADYYYYSKLKKSTYYGRDFCNVSDIAVNQDMDGTSATQLPNGTWHVRPMNEFLLFSSNSPSQPIQPVYMGTEVVRGIPADKWESCYIDRTQYRTVKRTSYFAQSTVVMPGTTSDNYAIPVQTKVSASLDFPNGTQIAEVDEVFNFLAFRPGIMETNDQLSPPKGVFCDSGPGQDLVSLKDVGISWPDHFNVRVETSTPNTARWQRFHLRYSLGREDGVRRLRYDFMPPGAEDFQSIIHDYSDNITYTIDRRVGTCQITAGVHIPPVSPIRDPIRFFVKHEARFIFNPPEKAWEFNGLRPCRGGSIQCTILTSSIPKFPAQVDSDTGLPSEEVWEATNVEYGWSVRAPFASPPPGQMKQFDYPVSLHLKLFQYQNPANPTPFNIITEDIQYEFYEMSYERHPYDFDTSLCYRSLNYEYLHLVFTLTLTKGATATIDSTNLNRRSLERNIYRNLANIMQIKYQRITEMEIEHEVVSNNIQVFFTLLGRTPRPGTQSGFADDEPTAQTASDSLKTAIDNGNLQFDVRTDDNTNVTFTGLSGSLTASKQYMSSHVAGRRRITESYTSSSQATAIIVGLLVGIVAGIILIAVYRIVKKQPMPSLPVSVSNPLPSINFKSKTTSASTSPSTNA